MKIEVSSDRERLDPFEVQALFAETFSAQNRSIELIEKIIRHSFCCGLYLENELIGFGRAVTDGVTHAHLLDVVIAQEHRGQGYGKKLVKEMLEDQKLKNLRVTLSSRDAQGLYSKLGFKPLENPEKYMELGVDDCSAIAVVS